MSFTRLPIIGICQKAEATFDAIIISSATTIMSAIQDIYVYGFNNYLTIAAFCDLLLHYGIINHKSQLLGIYTLAVRSVSVTRWLAVQAPK